MTTPQRVSARRSVVVAVEAGPTFLRGETLGDAARRHGMQRGGMGGLLRAAGVQPVGGRYVPAEVNAAVETRHQAPARAELEPHQPDADGNVACGSCWSIAAITEGRVTRCRWCAPAAGWGG